MSVWWEGAEGSSNITDRQRPSGGSSGNAGDSANQNNQNRGRQWDPKADDWAKDVSYSTRDVRSAIKSDDPNKGTRESFRQRTGSTVETPAERIARVKSKIFQDDIYLTEPIWNPKGLSYEDQLATAKEGERLLEGYKTDKYGYQNLPWWVAGEDWSSFFDDLKGRTDISDLGFTGTSKGWYGRYNTGTGGGGSLGGPGGGWDYGGYGGGGGGGYGGGGGGGGYAPPEKPQFPGQRGEQWGAQNPLQQAMIDIHGAGKFQQGFRRGGIVSLVT